MKFINYGLLIHLYNNTVISEQEKFILTVNKFSKDCYRSLRTSIIFIWTIWMCFVINNYSAHCNYCFLSFRRFLFLRFGQYIMNRRLIILELSIFFSIWFIAKVARVILWLVFKRNFFDLDKWEIFVFTANSLIIEPFLFS